MCSYHGWTYEGSAVNGAVSGVVCVGSQNSEVRSQNSRGRVFPKSHVMHIPPKVCLIVGAVMS